MNLYEMISIVLLIFNLMILIHNRKENNKNSKDIEKIRYINQKKNYVTKTFFDNAVEPLKKISIKINKINLLIEEFKQIDIEMIDENYFIYNEKYNAFGDFKYVKNDYIEIIKQINEIKLILSDNILFLNNEIIEKFDEIINLTSNSIYSYNIDHIDFEDKLLKMLINNHSDIIEYLTSLSDKLNIFTKYIKEQIIKMEII